MYGCVYIYIYVYTHKYDYVWFVYIYIYIYIGDTAIHACAVSLFADMHEQICIHGLSLTDSPSSANK